MSRYKWLAIAAIATATIYAVVVWNICEWRCYKLGTFASHGWDECHCMSPPKEPP